MTYTVFTSYPICSCIYPTISSLFSAPSFAFFAVSFSLIFSAGAVVVVFQQFLSRVEAYFLSFVNDDVVSEQVVASAWHT